MENNYDVIIIGAGIAGMTAAIYLKRYGKNILLVEKNYPGGQLTKIGRIDNYPGRKEVSGFELANTIYEQVKDLEIPVVLEEVIDIQNGEIKQVKTDKNQYQAKNIVLATGRVPRKLNLPHEEELIGHGLSYCATCDGPLYKNKEVFVVGGGESALQEALTLADICEKVTILHRRNQFRASKELIKKVENHPKIEIETNSVINTLLEENGVFLGVEIQKNGEKIEKKAAALFIYIGMDVDQSYYQNLQLCQEDGYIVVNQNNETSEKGIYACGDIVKKDIYQLVNAAAEGVKVAVALQNKE